MYLTQFIYNGGSTPGQVRHVVTNEVTEQGKLSGIDLDKKQLRHFNYDKIRFLTVWPLDEWPEESQTLKEILVELADAEENGQAAEVSLAQSVREKIESLKEPDINYVVYFDGDWKSYWYNDSLGKSSLLHQEEQYFYDIFKLLTNVLS